MQADSAEMLHVWMTALHKSIGAAIQFNRLNDGPMNRSGAAGSAVSDSLPGAGNFKKM